MFQASEYKISQKTNTDYYSLNIELWVHGSGADNHTITIRDYNDNNQKIVWQGDLVNLAKFILVEK